MTLGPIGDPALAFFRDVVEPTVAEFLDDPADKRRGCLACLALASMTEHYFHARPDLAASGDSALATLKGNLRHENKALGWMADVANATKHVLPSANRVGYGDVEVLRTDQAGIMRAGWSLGSTEVAVGSEREWLLRQLVEEARDFWRVRLNLAPLERAPSMWTSGAG